MPDNVINKVVYDGRTLIDLTDTTATANSILSGYGAYGADGVWIDGTATAGSLSGHVWQDNEGYIHLDDDGGDMYITTPLNVTTNGTYTAPTGVAYTPVSVSVPQGVNLPILTIHFDSNYDIDSVTCNKTYAECVSLSIDDIVDAIVQFDWDGSLQESTYGATGAYDSYRSLIRFNVADVNYAYCSYVITYNSNNTLSIVAHNTKDSGNMTVSEATVTAEAGYYPSASSKSVASGSATPAATITGTDATISTSSVSGDSFLTLSKSVNNTPQVTAGYVTSGTAGNSSVSLTAPINIDEGSTYAAALTDKVVVSSGTYTTGDVKVRGIQITNLAAGNIKDGVTVTVGDSVNPSRLASVTGTYSVSPTLQNKTVSPSTSQQSVQADSGYDGLGTVTVNAMPSGTAGTPTATKGTVSNHAVTVTPSVTNTTGYITGSTKTGTGVQVTASELASGNKAITENGTNIDVVGYSTVSVDVSGGLEYETGEWRQEEDGIPTISFTNVHTDPPVFVMVLLKTSGSIDTELFKVHMFKYVNWYSWLGQTVIPNYSSGSPINWVGRIEYIYRNSSTSSTSNGLSALKAEDIATYVTNTGFCPNLGNTAGIYYKGASYYKWVAVWV